MKQALTRIERRQAAHVGSKPPKRIASTTDPDSRQFNTGPELAAMEAQQINCYVPDAGQNSEAGPLSEATQEALAWVGEGRVLTELQWEALPRNNQGLIDKSAFVYDELQDTFRCPAGQTLVFLSTSQDKKKWGTAKRRRYGGCAGCADCVHAKLCCKHSDKGRLVGRDPYEAHRARLRLRMVTEEGREIYKRRKCTVEPRIGHIKHNMGVRRFLRRGLEKVTTEWMLVCTAVNLGILLRHWDEVMSTL